MNSKKEILQFIYSEYDYYYSYIKGLQNRVMRLNINDLRFTIFTKTIVDLTFKLEVLKKIIDFIESKEVK